jgi:AcrR family transcriptional regulator
MSEPACEVLDPRIRRTRQLLQQALGKLLETKDFDKISVQDIADAATVNRATFYDHYADKFALLECMAGNRFHELLAERGVCFDGTCSSGLRAMILGVCDYLAASSGADSERPGQLEPHLELAVVAVVRRMLLEGLRQHPCQRCAPPELVASAISWAIFGAAKEWLRTPNRSSSDEIVETVTALVTPMFGAPQAVSEPK